MNSVGVIICGAGKGLRANLGKNKLFATLQNQTVMERTLTAFDFPLISQIVVAVSPDEENEMRALCSPFARTEIVLGGKTRTQSVYNALKAVTTDIVLIHDGARPFVKRETIENCIQSVKAFGSGICAIPCTDTVAQTDGEKITGVLTRNSLRLIQTPQGFFTENIRLAYQLAFEKGETDFTDDSSVFAKYCGAPALCQGDKENSKLTYANDFKSPVPRQGFGVDTHAFGKAQPFVVLGGVKIPHESGFIAHSDGDVVVHAVMDALLSGAGLKDIGHYFPDTDERWKNASSLDMLQTVVELIRAEGYTAHNLSVAIQAEKPRLAPYIDQMKSNLAQYLQLDETAIGISAGTCEGLGFVGEGKGVSVYAVVSLQEV